VRHILIKPTFGAGDINKTFAKADSIYNLINPIPSLSLKPLSDFQMMATPGSMGGNVVNQKTGTTRFEADEVDPGVFFQLDKMNAGEISAPIQSLSAEGNTAFRILYLKSRSAPHAAT
jgi:peptidyl-prolyl cis-trans isomerase SurA